MTLSLEKFYQGSKFPAEQSKPYVAPSQWQSQLTKSIALTTSSLGLGWILSKLWNGANLDPMELSHKALIATNCNSAPAISQKVDSIYRRPSSNVIEEPCSSSLACAIGLIFGGTGSIVSRNPLPLAIGYSFCVSPVSASGYLFSPPDGSSPSNLQLANRASAVAETKHSELVATNTGLWSVSRTAPITQWNISSFQANIFSAANILSDNKQLFALVDNTERLVSCYNQEGNLLWKTEIGGNAVTNLVIDSNAVYVIYSAPDVEPVVTQVSALSVKSGSVLWTAKINDGSKSSPTVKLISPMLLLMIPNNEGTTYALSTTNGTTAWSSQGITQFLDGPEPNTVTTCRYEEFGADLYICDVVTGSIISSAHLGEATVNGINFSKDGKSGLLLRQRSVSFLSIDSGTINVVWTYRPGSYTSSLVSRPGVFYVTEDHRLQALTTSNPPLQLWQWQPLSYRVSSEGERGLIVYSNSNIEGRPLPIVCLDYVNGSVIWTSELQCEIAHLFSIAKGLIKLSCDSIALAIMNESTGAVMSYATKTKSVSTNRSRSLTALMTQSESQTLTDSLSSTQPIQNQLTDKTGLIVGATVGGVALLASSVAIGTFLRARWLKAQNDPVYTETSSLLTKNGIQGSNIGNNDEV